MLWMNLLIEKTAANKHSDIFLRILHNICKIKLILRYFSYAVKSRWYALGVYTDKGQIWWAYIRVGDLYTGGLILGRKNTSICNLLNFLLFFLFSSIKLVLYVVLYVVLYPSKICSKLTIKTPEYINLTIKLTIKTPLMSFWSLCCWLWTHSTSSVRLGTKWLWVQVPLQSLKVSFVDFDHLITSWGCCLMFWRFVAAGINLGK